MRAAGGRDSPARISNAPATPRVNASFDIFSKRRFADHRSSILHPHCGLCSQCLDRRVGLLAAGLGCHDPVEAYEVKLFHGGRPAGPHREMALAYVRSAARVSRMDDTAFFSNFGVAYTCRFIDVPASTGYGEPIQKQFKLRDGEKIVAAMSLDPRAAGNITPKKVASSIKAVKAS